ncbi:NUDIX domain-containing protein [Thalassospira sp. HF15]|uniref:NUDIX domain-containing protein n=1 Tax=Thalassospira sp. HF15 TaxID=2722755 RepID=UPI0014319AC0|nr:NUDIX domain-containing protein [Thalassospira sp. HF15]NIY74868.1 NUDIX domain-containing protein [Thalassospira sp. HF15]
MTENLAPTIRNCARAVIVRDGAILLLHKHNPSYGTRYALPGGAQEENETLQAALIRECEEELGTAISVGDLVHVADFFKPRSAYPKLKKHAVEFLFSCSVPDGYVPANGPAPDKNQKDVVWLPLAKLPNAPLFPNDLRAVLMAAAPEHQEHPVYLGQIT